jgi:uncharacterized protein YhbP (UPF0306 family)
MSPNDEKAHQIISANRYMTLATSAFGETWIAPVAYAFDEHFNFYWYSERTAKHSLHIYANPEIAVAIFDSSAPSEKVDGLQISGIASEVEPSQISEVAELYYTQSFPDESVRRSWQKPNPQFIGDAPFRFYRFTPKATYKCDLDIIDIDRRILVNL